MQYRRFYVTGTEFIHHNQPEKESDGAAFRGPDSIKSSSRARLSDALFPHRAGADKNLPARGDGRLQ